MSFQVEFFGIPRVRAGTSHASVLEGVERTTLAKILQAVGQQLPGFAKDCLVEDKLCPGIVVSIGGQRFVTNESTEVENDESILILSADAGG